MRPSNEFIERTTPLEKRFWSKVQKTNTCWIWTGAKRSNTYYGILYCGARWLGSNGPDPNVKRLRYRAVAAHRLSWQMANGAIPLGMCVCHHCDNPACVRPDHLFLGTPRENAMDRTAKGRSPGAPGESNRHAKLTSAAALYIRNAYASGISSIELAKEFGLALISIQQIINGRHWKKIGGPIPIRRRGDNRRVYI